MARLHLPSKRTAVRWGAVLGPLVALYAALGFLLAPRLVRTALVERGGAALHRPVTVERVRVNPFALSLRIDGLSVGDHDGGVLASWASLYVRYRPLALLRKDVGLAELRLDRPYLRVALNREGQPSFQDLLPEPRPGPAAPPAPAPDRAGGGLGLAVGRLAVTDARVAFSDGTRQPAFTSEVGPLTFGLQQFRTRGGQDSPFSFEASTESGEHVSWSGTLLGTPLRSAGTLIVAQLKLSKYQPYTRDAAAVEIREGRLSLEARYEVEWSAARHAARILDGHAELTGLALARGGDRESPVVVEQLAVRGVSADVLERTARVALVELRGGQLHAVREAQGRWNLVEMARTRAEAPTPRADAGRPFGWSVDAVEVGGLQVTVEDRAAPQPPAALALRDVTLRVSELRAGPGAAWPLTASLTWPGGGRVAVEGRVVPAAARGELTLEASELDLAPLAAYLDPALPLRLAEGRASGKLRAAFDAAGEPARWSVAGDARVDGLRTLTPRREELLRWRALEVGGIDVGSTPPHATVASVRLVEPRLALRVREDGTTSLTPPGAGGGPAAQPAAGARGPAWRTAIRSVRVERGQVGFADRSVEPPVVFGLAAVEARLKDLSSDPRVRSTFDLSAKVDGAAPLQVTGTINPLQGAAFTDLAVRAKGIELTPLGPYVGKYVGYGLRKGKLDLDLQYRIEDRALAAGNVVRFDQLYLGEATGSPDATGLPVRLALAILRDKDGVILLDVPVEGNLDDPEFRLGKVIWHAVGNVLVKLVSSPFSLLASLVGSKDEDLSMAEFAAGSAELEQAGRRRVELLARSLAERPALGLELEGVATAAADGDALRRDALERRLRHARFEALHAAGKAPASEDEVVLSAEERARLVAALHAAMAASAEAAPSPAAAQPAAKAGAEATPARAAAPPTPAEQEAALLAATPVDPEAVRALAAARAAAARDALLAAGVAPDRLFSVEGGERAAKEQGARVYFTVR